MFNLHDLNLHVHFEDVIDLSRPVGSGVGLGVSPGWPTRRKRTSHREPPRLVDCSFGLSVSSKERCAWAQRCDVMGQNASCCQEEPLEVPKEVVLHKYDGEESPRDVKDIKAP